MASAKIRERSIETNGIQLNVAIAGEPGLPALLLLHGLYDRWETWDPIIRAFAGDIQVIAPDLRGHARSDHPNGGYEPGDYADDIVGVLDALAADQVVSVGHSLGALIGTFLAAEYPNRVRSLILVDPPFEQNEATREWLQILLDAKRQPESETYNIVRELNILSGDEAEWRRETDWLRATADGPFEALIKLINEDRTAQLTEVLRRVTCPTLLLQADPNSGGALTDSGADRAMSQLPSASHQKFAHTGHSIHLERTDAFVQAVRDVLQTAD